VGGEANAGRGGTGRGAGAGAAAGAGSDATTGGAAADGTGSLGSAFGIGAAFGVAALLRLTGVQTFFLRPVRLSRTVLQVVLAGAFFFADRLVGFFLRGEIFTGDSPRSSAAATGA
jgi:hypothetical protein